MDINKKRAQGQFYTEGNPFYLSPFREWAQQANLRTNTVLEPFAGANNIIHTLQSLYLCGDFASYDITPAHPKVIYQDTICNFPTKFDVCVTNPPWLARNSATRRNLPYPQTSHDDLYKHCLELCLQNCAYVAMLLPASYLQSELFRHRLQTYILLHGEMFNDTENPTCLALFGPTETNDVAVYYDDKSLGKLSKLDRHIPFPTSDRQVRFNDPSGEIGFFSFDNTHGPTIRFCEVDEIADYAITVSSRFITRISGDFSDLSKMIKTLNDMINEFRSATQDVFLTPFKGIRKDGEYRRRMDFTLARKIINAA